MSIKQQVEAAQTLLEGFAPPLLPEAALQLQKLFNETAMPSPEKVKQLISMNPFLAAELVSLANIPSLSNAVGVIIKDIDSAIYRLGNKRLKNYILSIYIKQIINDYQIKGLSYHCQDIAIIASTIAGYSKYVGPDEAYLLGLIHDIGAFALIEKDSSYGDQFVTNQFNHYSMEKEELKRYGTTHSALGYVIAHSWNIPNYIAQTILLHHTKSVSAFENKKLINLIAILEMAHAISIKKTHKNEVSQEAEQIFTDCQKILDLSDDDLEEIFQNS